MALPADEFMTLYVPEYIQQIITNNELWIIPFELGTVPSYTICTIFITSLQMGKLSL